DGSGTQSLAGDGSVLRCSDPFIAPPRRAARRPHYPRTARGKILSRRSNTTQIRGAPFSPYWRAPLRGAVAARSAAQYASITLSIWRNATAVLTAQVAP